MRSLSPQRLTIRSSPTGGESMTPTAWYLYEDDEYDDVPILAARSFWPDDVTAEVWSPRGATWEDRPIFEQLSEDASWVQHTKAEVEAWMAVALADQKRWEAGSRRAHWSRPGLRPDRRGIRRSAQAGRYPG